MENGVTINHQGFDYAAAENWYLSCMPIKPIPKVKIRFEDGREYIYKGKNTLKIGDVAVIGRGCNTSFEMGEVTAVGVAGGGKSYMSNAQYVFSTSPSQDEIKKMSGRIFDYQDVDTAFKKLIPEMVCATVSIPVVDIEIENLLFSICILAHEKLATPAAAKKAKGCLEKPKHLCGELFGLRMEERFYAVSDPCLQLNFSGYYPHWEDDFLTQSLCNAIETQRDIYIDENSICYKKCSIDLEKLINENKDFACFYNELIFRSALSLIIRGGFVNLLRAALGVHMPIESFFEKLMDLAKETGSTHCYQLLDEHKSEYIS